MLHKLSQNPWLPGSHRHFNLLSNIGKIFEKNRFSRNSEHCSSYYITPYKQFEFRFKHSCVQTNNSSSDSDTAVSRQTIRVQIQRQLYPDKPFEFRFRHSCVHTNHSSSDSDTTVSRRTIRVQIQT
ncbi:hypothetical protein AVEN_246374-1 [Araneus ventricosus]|uniref:Uncharacterized protein n=1 Tax=Araneus ventricosus TaxID=182803 RepID=A0A4Y2KT56_ARAVE|nr:hypothetical protein AVEN_246374-1 [Araneus ventricosus]